MQGFKKRIHSLAEGGGKGTQRCRQKGAQEKKKNRGQEKGADADKKRTQSFLEFLSPGLSPVAHLYKAESAAVFGCGFHSSI